MREEEKKTVSGSVKEEQLSLSVHSIIISSMSICDLTSYDKMM